MSTLAKYRTLQKQPSKLFENTICYSVWRKTCFEKLIFGEIKTSHSKQKGTNSSAEWHFGLSWASSPWYPPIHEAFFTISHKNKVLNFLCFSNVRSPDAKRAQITLIRLWYVRLIEVKHDKKSTSMIKRLNI